MCFAAFYCIYSSTFVSCETMDTSYSHFCNTDFIDMLLVLATIFRNMDLHYAWSQFLNQTKRI
jgi:hypothetical protein